MPHEVFPIRSKAEGQVIGSNDNTEDVSNSIKNVFDEIAGKGGEFVTSIVMIEQEFSPGSGGKPESVAYIVADFPDNTPD